MSPTLRIEGGDAHQTMDSVFALETPVSVLALDPQSAVLNPRAVARLVDPFHDIKVTVAIRSADLTITGAQATMRWVPYADRCLAHAGT